MTQTPQTPAGWYPQGGVERWWDGNAWSDHTRPIQPAQPQATPGYQQTYQQPGAVQPGAAPGAVQPGYYQAPQPPKSHLARNLLIVFGALFVLFVGGCVALVAVVGNEVDNAVNDDTLGGPNNPLTITEGKAFEVDGFEYADGWDIADAPVSGLFQVDDLKVTNHRGKADRALVEIKLLNASEIVATATCTADGIDKIAEDTTVTLDCSSGDTLPAAYDKITIQDAF